MVDVEESRFLIPLFEALNREDIRYAVLRNAEFLPFRLDGGDIDLLLHPLDYKRGLLVIQEVINACGGSILAQAQSPCFLQIMAMGRKDDFWWGVCLDIFEEVRYLGAMPLIDVSALESRVSTRNGVFTLDADVANLLGVVKEFVYNGVISGRYSEGALHALKTETSLRCFSCLGKDGAKLLRDVLYQKSSKAVYHKSAKIFRRLLKRRAAQMSLYGYFKNVAAFYLSKGRRLFKPPGQVVAVLGTDGAGKSTILEAIKPLMMSTTHKAYIVHHLKPDLLPPLAYLKGKKAFTTGPVTNPHGSKPSGPLGSLFRLLYLVTDYLLGYWLKVLPQTVKIPPALYIFDRYAYDILLDPKRFRISLPRWVIRLAITCVPRPDVIICLYGDPQRIADRKKELPLSEVCRQIEEIKAFAATHPRAILVSTTLPVNETCRLVLEAIQSSRHVSHEASRVRVEQA
jgi:adenylate kinase